MRMTSSRLEMAMSRPRGCEPAFWPLSSSNLVRRTIDFSLVSDVVRREHLFESEGPRHPIGQRQHDHGQKCSAMEVCLNSFVEHDLWHRFAL